MQLFLKRNFFIVLPYLRTIWFKLKQKLRTCFNNSLPQCNIRIILKSTNSLFSLFHFDDILPKEIQSDIIYKFWGGSCNNAYYGKTECHLNGRSSEQIGISHLSRKRVEFKQCAVSDQLLLHKQHDFPILYRDNNGFRLILREPLLISKDSPALDKNTASVLLSLFD